MLPISELFFISYIVWYVRNIVSVSWASVSSLVVHDRHLIERWVYCNICNRFGQLRLQSVSPVRQHRVREAATVVQFYLSPASCSSFNCFRSKSILRIITPESDPLYNHCTRPMGWKRKAIPLYVNLSSSFHTTVQ